MSVVMIRSLLTGLLKVNAMVVAFPTVVRSTRG